MVAIVDNVSATGNCSLPVANRCHGMSMVGTTTGGVASGRCFFFTTASSAPVCSTGGIGTTSNQAYEMDAGNCLTLYYWNVPNGLVPPATPNKVTLEAYFDSLAAVYKTFVAPPTAPPSSGDSYTFCATDTGNVGGTARAGTWYTRIMAVKDDAIGGIGNYNINSEGSGTQDTSFDAGGVRGKTIVSNVARNAYPAGSTFAYGTAGDETITVTATMTQPGADNAVETSFTSVLDAATFTVGLSGSTTDVDGTSQAQNFVVDQSLPFANSPYVPGWTIVGNSVLFGEKWTILAASGHGGGLTRNSDTFIYDGSFNIDPRIVLDSDGVGTFATADDTDKSYLGTCTGSLIELFNRGETVCHSWYIMNARSELLSRAMTFRRDDASDNQCVTLGSITPTSNLYSNIGTIPTGGSCAAAADTTGSARHLDVANTDQIHDSGTIFFVSSLLRFDADGSGSPDNEINVCLNTCPATEITLYNRGETVDFEGYLINARGTQYQETGVQWRAEDSLGAQTNSQAISHSAGKYSGNAFALGASEKATADLVGDPHRWTATKNGNTATSATPIFGVSSLYFVDAHTQNTSVLNQDDYPTENANEDFQFFIRGDGMGGDASDRAYGWCHVVGVRKDIDIDTTGSNVAWSWKDPTTATIASGNTDTGADGWTPTTLNRLVSTPLGTWVYTCTATFTGNTGTYAQNVTVGVEGGNGTIQNFMADPLKVYTALNDDGETLVAISASYLDGTARTGAATEINVTIYDPAWTAVVSSANPDEVGFGAYSLNFTPATSGLYFIVVNTTDPDSGEPIGVSNAFALVANVGSLMHDTAFTTLTGLTGSEFAAVLALAVVGIILWLRSTDVGVRAFGAIMPMLGGVLVILLTLQEGVGTLWQGSIGLGAILVVVGGYLLVRLFLDDFLEKREAGEA